MGETTDKIGSPDDFNDPAIRRSSVTRVPAAASGAENATDSGDEATQIRSDIESTRADLSETINALQDKLDPTRIAEQVKEQIKEKATEAYDTAKAAVKEATVGKAEKIVANVSEAVTDITGRAGTALKSSSAVQYISDNPIPFALVGVGLGMLALSSRKKASSSYSADRRVEFPGSSNPGTTGASASQPSITDRARSAVSGVTDTARSAASSATSAVSSAAGSVADTARQQFNYVSGQVQQGTRVAGDRYNTLLQENPMALGMVALAAGALVGMVLPGTRVEGEYLGEARDRLVDQAKSAAQGAVEKVQRVAGEAGQSLKEAAQKEGLMGGGNATT